jgi:N-acetylglucosamine-6-sulfatase
VEPLDKASRVPLESSLKTVGHVVLLFFLCFAVSSAGGTSLQEAQAAQTRPNILFILTDDQDPNSLARMDKVRHRLVAEGVRFERAFVTTPVCCPSRATFLRGQYAHNHGTLTGDPPTGGWEKFRADGRERSTIATWLDAAGYTTGYMGKYLNGYGRGGHTTHVPAGWDRWWGWQGSRAKFGDHYKVNEDGEIRTYDRDRLHDTDYLSREAEAFVRARRGDQRPWLLVVAPNTAHEPNYVSERHRGLFREAQMPRPPSFNESDVSDKPRWIRFKPRLDADGIAKSVRSWRQRQRDLQSVDDLVGNLVGALTDTNQLRDTYVVYTSDNGYLLYRHRVKGKGAPYEESIGVPLIVRGPGVSRGATRDQIVANTDWAPTIADWAGVEPPNFVDGSSFSPLLGSSPPPWRKRLLLEWLHPKSEHAFRGVRTSDDTTYVEYYRTGEGELYRLDEDPFQLENAYRSTDSGTIASLEDRLRALQECARAGCRAAEGF